jgi:hypothetical protein
MRGHGAKFKRKLEEAVAAMLTQRTVEEAARSVGISTATLMRWQKEPEFDAQYRQAKRAAFGQTIARLQQGSPAAATTLMKLMLDAATPPSTRARCSEAIINFATKAIELEDVEARVSALERATEGSKR